MSRQVPETISTGVIVFASFSDFRTLICDKSLRPAYALRSTILRLESEGCRAYGASTGTASPCNADVRRGIYGRTLIFLFLKLLCSFGLNAKMLRMPPFSSSGTHFCRGIVRYRAQKRFYYTQGLECENFT